MHKADGTALHAELSTICQGTLITMLMLLWLLYRGEGGEVALRMQQDTGCSFLLEETDKLCMSGACYTSNLALHHSSHR